MTHKQAGKIKVGDTIAIHSTDISFTPATILSVEKYDNYDMDIKYEYEAYGKKHSRKIMVRKEDILLVVSK